MKKIGSVEIPETVDEHLGEHVSAKLFSALRNGIPPDALLVAARWWQLETFLRTVAYIELRAKFGPDWKEAINAKALKRAGDAQTSSYMPSPDDTDLLAFLDTFDLFDLIERWWEDLFDQSIGVAREVWKGRTIELRSIRHRVAHCRRPHRDDADRIEQTLRDLESGADRALRSYVEFWQPRSDLADPILEDWVAHKHPIAQRLIDHGHQNKGIHFELQATHRPWASLDSAQPLAGAPGIYWIMSAHLDYDQRHIFIDDYWAEPGVQRSLPLIGHVIHPNSTSVFVTFPAVGDAAAISDAIGSCFEAVFRASHVGRAQDSPRHPWRRPTGPDFDPRVDAGGLLSILSGLNHDDPVRYFGA